MFVERSLENTEQTNKDEKLRAISIIKEKITGNYKIIQKIVSCVPILDGSLLRELLTKNIFRTFLVGYMMV